MDPLTIATAVVTFVEVAAYVGKSIRLLRSIAQSGAEFCALVTELDFLHAFIEQLAQTVSDLSQSGTRASASSLQRLEYLRLELSRTAEQLGDLAGDLVAASKPNKNGEKKVPVIQWQRHKSKVSTLRAQCRHSRDDVCAFLKVLEPSVHAVNHTQVMLRIEGLSASTTHSVKQVTDHAAQQVVGRIDNLEAAIHSLMHRTSTTFQGRPPLAGARGATRGQERTKYHERHFNGKGPDLASVHATLEQRCSVACRCQCHIVSQLSTPAWLRYAIGGCLLRYNAIPIFDRRPCNAAQCRISSKRSMRLRVELPSWLLGYSVQCATSWDAFGTGAKLAVTIPRAVDARPVTNAIWSRNIHSLYDSLAKRAILPTDVDASDGQPLLSICLRSSLGLLEVVSPFLTALASSVCDANGISVADRAQMRLWRHPDLDPGSVSLLERIIELGSDHLTASPSPIRDAVLGISDFSLQQALVTDPDSVMSQDSYGYTPLQWAACRNQPDAALLLLQHGADPNLQDEELGRTPLHMACELGRLAVSSVLLRHGADANVESPSGWTPLSIGLRHPNLVRLLLKHGAEPNPPEGNTMNESSPLHTLSHPFRGPVTSEGLSKVLHDLIDAGINLEHTNYSGDTPLLYAAWEGRANVIRALVECGARIDAVNDVLGDTVLTLSATCDSPSGQVEFLRDRLDLRLDPDARDKQGRSPLDLVHTRVRSPKDMADEFHSRPLTHLDVFNISALVVELRERNWCQERFLETRDRLRADGSHSRLKLWLGREYLRMQYLPSFGAEKWEGLADPSRWYYDQDNGPAEREPWYETTEGGGHVFRRLFGEHQTLADDGSVDSDWESESGDEFFDAMDERELS